WESGTTDALTQACLAECLLLQGGTDWKKSVSAADQKMAREVAEKAKTLAASDSYVRFVAGLTEQVQDRLPAAAKEYVDAFAQKKDWQNAARRQLAADACYDAGVAVQQSAPKDAVAFFQLALALSSKPTADCRIKLLAAALASNQPLVFKETLTAVP